LDERIDRYHRINRDGRPINRDGRGRALAYRPLLIDHCLSIIEFPECSQRVMKAVEKLRPADKLGQVMPVQV
jgi:hypothetical protein